MFPLAQPPKRKTEGDSAESSDKQVKRATTGYTSRKCSNLMHNRFKKLTQDPVFGVLSENERAILMAMTKIALENCKVSPTNHQAVPKAAKVRGSNPTPPLSDTLYPPAYC